MSVFCDSPKPLSGQLSVEFLDLSEFEFDRSVPAEHRDGDLDLLSVQLDLFDLAQEVDR